MVATPVKVWKVTQARMGQPTASRNSERDVTPSFGKIR